MSEHHKPCPFCDGMNIEHSIVDRGEYGDTDVIVCNICSAELPSYWEKGEFQGWFEWNTRPCEEALQADHEAVMQQIRAVLDGDLIDERRIDEIRDIVCRA